MWCRRCLRFHLSLTPPDSSFFSASEVQNIITQTPTQPLSNPEASRPATARAPSLAGPRSPSRLAVFRSPSTCCAVRSRPEPVPSGARAVRSPRGLEPVPSLVVQSWRHPELSLALPGVRTTTPLCRLPSLASRTTTTQRLEPPPPCLLLLLLLIILGGCCFIHGGRWLLFLFISRWLLLLLLQDFNKKHYNVAREREEVHSENEIVQMFRLPNSREEMHRFPMEGGWDSRNGHNARTLDERFIRILKIFKWGPDAEKALEVLKMKVNTRLVREVLKVHVEVTVKIQFFKWVGKKRNFEHDATTYMALIRCLDENRFIGELWKTIQDMVKSSCAIAPAELSEIVKILGRAKMVNKALSVFYQVKGRKCRPTASTYNAVILMLMQEGHHEKVHELYNEMCSEGHCFPDTVTYSALISAFAKLNRDDSAIRLFDEMKENGLQPTAKIYTILMGIYFKLGKIEEALSLIQEMRMQRCSLTVFTYTELIRGLGKSGRVEDAYSTYKNMLKDGCRPDVVLMNNLVNILGRSNRLKDAIKLFNEMKLLNCTPNVVTYNTIIKSLFDSKAPPSEAASWFERMRKDGVVPSSFTYSILIDGFCKTNQVEKALLLLEEMDEKGFPPCPAAYCSLINSLGKAKRYEAANELFQELKENCGRSSARVYAVMIKHFGKCGRLNEAINLFNEMKKLGCAPDVYAYNALMSGMVREDMIDGAFSLFRAMEENGCTPDINSHNIILNGLARTGGPKRAMEMLTHMKNSTTKPDAVSYNTVLGCLSRAGLFEEAAKLMKEMSSKGFHYDLITYSSILEAVGKVDEHSNMVES